MSDPKRDLRQRLLAARAAIPERETKSTAIARHALRDIDFDGIIAGYCAMREEADPAPLLHALAERKAVLALPVIQPNRALAFCPWRLGDPLHENRLGMMEPRLGHTVIPDLILVPLLAFDEVGQRLGYGGGYYDRLFGQPEFAHVRRIGLAFAAQRVDRLPSQGHDVTLDAVVTEDGIHRFDSA